MADTVERKIERMRKTIRLQRPDRLPCSDWSWAEYRPEVYHLGDVDDLPPPGEVAVAADGKRKFTRDGGVWAVGDEEKYRTWEDVVATDPEQFEVEEVGSAMLDEMRRLVAQARQRGYPLPMHYGTLVTRATIEFGWEPFLMAAALEPAAFGRLLDRFGQASLAIIQGWAKVEEAELVVVHDDIAGTKGLLLSPQWLRQYVFPWYERLFSTLRAGGKKSLYISDGNYLEALDDVLATGPDGLYVESSSMDPAEVMKRGGPDKLYMVKTDSRAVDFGTPDDLRQELQTLRELHHQYPGMMIYRGGGNPRPGNAEAFARLYEELLVYE
ncbi:MAG: hypothetical protein J7M26_10415 [Armatimonadetes bacterium]|nr:hypothetical protein [Armatimonadota bacterium]